MTTKIYTLTDPNTNQVRYVGKSNNPIKRYYKHLNESTKSIKTHKNNWVSKLLKDNKKPILYIIDEVPINEWVFWETYWISQFKTWGFDLVNETDGGDGCTFGNKTSFKKGQVAWNKGISPNDITKNKISKSLNGTKQSVSTIEKRSKTLKTNYKSDLDLLLKSSLKTRFNKGNNPWNKNNNGYKLGGKKTAKPVLQLDLDGNFLNEYTSCKEAATTINGNIEMIRRCCNGINLTSGGFKWKWK